MRWNVSRSDMYPATFVGSASEVLVVETDFGLLSEEDALSPFALLRILNGGGPGVRWWRTGQPQTTVAGSSRLWTTCSKDGAPDDQLLCGAFDGRRTRMALIDSATGQVTPVGWIHGRFLNYGRGSGGWATGFAESTAIALHVDTRQAVEIGAGHDSDSLSSISATNSIVGGVWLHPGSTTVRLYRRATPLVASSR
jgi:hypothetical protein